MSFLDYCKALGIRDAIRIRSKLSWVDESAKIGVRTIISPGVWIGPDVEIGNDCYIGPNAAIGAPGFGYEEENGAWRFREHPFGVRIGNNVSVGANTVIDRGRHRDTCIGRGTKVDGLCFISHNVTIGRNCLIIANSMLAGSSEVGDDCWIGPSAQLTDHVKVGNGARIGIGSVVLGDVPENQLWVGVPAKFKRVREEPVGASRH